MGWSCGGRSFHSSPALYSLYTDIQYIILAAVTWLQLVSSTRYGNMDRKRKPASGSADKVWQKKKKALVADAAKCAKIADFFKQYAGDDDYVDDTAILMILLTT